MLVFTSCEKVIDVDIKESPNQMVIEGSITDSLTMQTIKLTKSVNYTESNVYPPVTGASVVVTDDAGFTLRFEEKQPGVYTFGPFRGGTNRKYTMTVVAEGKTYTAQSTMPTRVKIDSLSITEITFGNSKTKVINVHLTDPPVIKNQYRYIMKVNGTITRRVYANDDRLQDGNAIKEQLFYSDDDDNEELNSGDRVDIELQCIDRPIYKYWFTLSAQTQNGPGGGVTPGNPPSNISNGALGYFSAHTTQSKSITIE